MNKIIYFKVLKLFLIAVFTKIGFGSSTQYNTELIVIAISESYAINPLSEHLFYLQSGMSFKSPSETRSYKYLPDFGFGYKISKNLSLEGSIFNHLSYSSPEQIIRGGVQYFFGTTDTLDWSCSIKKVNYRAVKNFDINSVTLDISKSIRGDITSKIYQPNSVKDLNSEIPLLIRMDNEKVIGTSLDKIGDVPINIEAYNGTITIKES